MSLFPLFPGTVGGVQYTYSYSIDFTSASDHDYFTGSPYFGSTLYTETVTVSEGLLSGVFQAYMYASGVSPNSKLKTLSGKGKNSNNTGGFTLTGFVTDPTSPFTRAIGLMAMTDFHLTGTTGNYLDVGWSDVSTYYTATNNEGGLIQSSIEEMYDNAIWGSSPGGGDGLFQHTEGLNIKYAFVLGGYDTNRDPWDGTTGGFDNGMVCFSKGFWEPDKWFLQYKNHKSSGSSLVFKLGGYVSSNTWNSYTNALGISEDDMSSLLVPDACDWMQDTNGTALPSHTMNVGSGWSAEAGTMEIQLNAAKHLTGTSVGGFEGCMIITDTGLADVFLSSEMKTWGTDNNHADHCSLVIRWDATGNDGWTVELYRGGGLYLKEWTGAGSTVRQNRGSISVSNTIYHVQAFSWEDKIKIYAYNNALGTTYTPQGLWYGSATRNQTTTTHGVGMRRGLAFDPGTSDGNIYNFSALPVGSNDEYSLLESYSEQLYGTQSDYSPWELYATFSGTYQPFYLSDGDILDVANFGVPVGNLIVGEATADQRLTSGSYMSENVTTPNWNTGIRDTDAKTRALGKAFFFGDLRREGDESKYSLLCMIKNTSEFTYTSRLYLTHRTDGAGQALTSWAPANTNERSWTVDSTIVPGDKFSAAFLTGGYNSSGEPYTTGDTKANYTYGALMFQRKGTGQWLLGFKDERDNTSSLYPVVNAYSNSTYYTDISSMTVTADSVNDTLDDLMSGTRDLSVSNGTTFTHIADAYIEVKIGTLPSTGTIDIEFRRQDASNLWKVSVNAAGDMYLYERVTGSDTSRGSQLALVSAGSHIHIATTGTTISVYSPNAQIDYGSATNFSTETAGQISISSGTVSWLAHWPRGTSDEYAALLSYDGIT